MSECEVSQLHPFSVRIRMSGATQLTSPYAFTALTEKTLCLNFIFGTDGHSSDIVQYGCSYVRHILGEFSLLSLTSPSGSDVVCKNWGTGLVPQTGFTL